MNNNNNNDNKRKMDEQQSSEAKRLCHANEKDVPFETKKGRLIHRKEQKRENGGPQHQSTTPKYSSASSLSVNTPTIDSFAPRGEFYCVLLCPKIR